MDIKSEFSKQLTKINVKTSTFLEENKLRTYIQALESDVKELYAKAGEIGYILWKEQRTDEPQLTAVYEEIQGKFTTIEEQERQLKELTEKSKQVLGESRAAAQERIFCTSCGESNPAVANFCKKCGNKLH